MPNVGGVQYPYTPEGIAAAQQAQRQIQKTGPYMSPPLTRPSHPMAQRKVPDLQPARSNNRVWRGEASRSPSSPYATVPTYEDRYAIQSDPSRLVGGAPIRGQHTYARSPSNPAAQRPIRDLTPYVPSYPGLTPSSSAQWHELANRVAYNSPRGVWGGDMGWQSFRSPSDPSVRYPAGYSDMMATRPITQAPRGQTIQTTDPGAGYGMSPSGPTAQKPRQPANYGKSPSNPNWTPGG